MRKKKLRLKLFDEAHLEEKWDIRFSRFYFFIISLLIMTLCVGIGIGIVWFTPLKTRLPGYMKESQRSASADMLVRLDSLIEVNEKNQRYLDNIASIFDPESRLEDTITEGFTHGHFTPDSLSSASEKEIQYVLSMQTKKETKRTEANGAQYGRINVGGIHPEAQPAGMVPMSQKLKLKVPKGADIGSVGDGIILSLTPNTGNSYSILIQHPGGFLSGMSGIKALKVKEGEAVKAGGKIGESAGEVITVQMWKDGIGQNPENYIQSKK